MISQDRQPLKIPWQIGTCRIYMYLDKHGYMYLLLYHGCCNTPTRPLWNIQVISHTQHSTENAVSGVSSYFVSHWCHIHGAERVRRNHLMQVGQLKITTDCLLLPVVTCHAPRTTTDTRWDMQPRPNSIKIGEIMLVASVKWNPAQWNYSTILGQMMLFQTKNAY